MSDRSDAQDAQLNNRDSSGRFRRKSHGDVEDTAGVLGISGPDTGQTPRKTYCVQLSSVHSQVPGASQAALESESAMVRLAARSGWDLSPSLAAQRTPEESRCEAAMSS